MTDDDPTAWLGDPIGMFTTEAGELVVSVPPGERNSVVISVLGAPSIDSDLDARYVRLGLEDARAVRRALDAGIAQIEEHSGG